MRTIKFRAKRTKLEDPLERWIEGSYVEFTNYNGDEEIKIVSQSGYKNDVYPETVCQFTGLYDKNRNEIYDKDILRVTSQEKSFNIVVKWSDEAMAFMAYYADGKQSPFSWFSDITVYELEIIGNIFDNKDLMKVENNE